MSKKNWKDDIKTKDQAIQLIIDLEKYLDEDSDNLVETFDEYVLMLVAIRFAKLAKELPC